MKQIIYYSKRWSETNMAYITTNVIMTIAIVAGTCFVLRNDSFETYSATKTCLFAFLMCCVWCGAFNSLALFFSEKDYAMEDMHKVLSPGAYMVTNIFFQFILCLLESVSAVMVLYLFFDISGEKLAAGSMFGDYFVTVFLVMFSCDMLAFVIGLVGKDIKTIMSTVPIILILQFLFSGALIDLDGDLMIGVSEVVAAKWGFRALGSIADLNQYIPALMPTYEEYNHVASNVTSSWYWLLGLSVVFAALAWIALEFKVNSVEK